ncbi:VOC family protein [Terribacillus saccharophilus]|uniref:Glyoxalase/bleomycin resistance/extradiol dioxygenase family protein n=1 Tax=Terribacillus saccharophilus TaxID=361277 RepID=A0A268A9I6_9BACI|nr:VOC family protein [Terribacillus saccharophilus]PAD20778.1 glyoxalase/bleomycin resistance/extradiol dioxygenase family protein [Terribacillus saccharophilus]PAF17729.1 glyoxalase/bleomycin resistance/extradiol dioxygenase family protein [Terribacillus saccharophilus]PAF21423.1 glyoxalase/bleomycin resistance/extradiol dioxygenase family protein [Terribacillus saccharophilus]
MINHVGQIMLYVSDQDQAVHFWTEKLGFQVLAKEDDGQGMRWIEIAPSKGAETSIILHNKAFISKMEPELNLGTPSLMFFSDNLDKLHNDLLTDHVTVGEIVAMPTGRVFNFADYEGNYFAIMEKND